MQLWPARDPSAYGSRSPFMRPSYFLYKPKVLRSIKSLKLSKNLSLNESVLRKCNLLLGIWWQHIDSNQELWEITGLSDINAEKMKKLGWIAYMWTRKERTRVAPKPPGEHCKNCHTETFIVENSRLLQ